jgi:Ca-activated chloride channel family protein
MDGTAIGMGLATSVDRLRESKSKSKVIILLTDGANNRGQIDPLSAAEIAAKYKIKIYTIGMSGLGVTKLNIPTMGDSEIDEDLLKQIASMTSGKYYRAIDNNKLTEIYEEINRLEKTSTENKVYSQRNDMYYPWVIAALILLAAEYTLRQTYLKSIT